MPERPEVKLSYMQWYVARALLISGASSRRLSAQLGITENTVKSHLKTIFARAGVAGRTELACLAWSGQLTLLNPAGQSLLPALQRQAAA